MRVLVPAYVVEDLWIPCFKYSLDFGTFPRLHATVMLSYIVFIFDWYQVNMQWIS